MKKLLDPTLDPIFKAVFTSNTKESKEALRSMISAFVGHKVKDVIVSTNEPAISGIKEKQVRLDIHCIFADSTSKKNHVNLEMTLCPTKTELLRTEYYVARLHGMQENSGKEYEELAHSYQVSIVFEDIEKDEYALHCFEYYDKEHKVSAHGRTHIIVLEAKKLEKKLKDTARLGEKELWGAFFVTAKEKRTKILKELTKRSEGIKMATQSLNRISASMQMKIAAMRAEKARRDFINDRTDAFKSGREEGIKEGREKGREEGMEKGMEKGREKGREEGMEKGRVEIAKNLLKLGTDMDLIAKSTGLSLSQIKTLKK